MRILHIAGNKKALKIRHSQALTITTIASSSSRTYDSTTVLCISIHCCRPILSLNLRINQARHESDRTKQGTSEQIEFLQCI